jgi:plastocyanin
MACSKDESIETSRTGSVTSTNTGSPNASPTDKVILILSSGYSPDSLFVPINGAATWVNQDNQVHTVTSDKFDSGDIAPGAAFKYRFESTGKHVYYCRYHSNRGVVEVGGIK